MDANTPATQAFPQGKPVDDTKGHDNPVQGNPVHDNPVHDNPVQGNPVHDNPVQDIPVRDGDSTSDSGVGTPQPGVSKPVRPKGPNVSAIVLGLVALVFGGLIIASETMDLTIDWSGKGPVAIIGIGVLLVVLGGIGLVRRHDDA